MKMSKEIIRVYILAALIVGLAIGALDYFIDQMLLVTILLILPNAILGYLRPSLAWLSALSCMLGFILIDIILGYGFNIPPARWPYFNILVAIIMPIPSFIGSYWGAALRWVFDAAKRSKQAQSQ
jgi:hypothetical protein